MYYYYIIEVSYYRAIQFILYIVITYQLKIMQAGNLQSYAKLLISDCESSISYAK